MAKVALVIQAEVKMKSSRTQLTHPVDTFDLSSKMSINTFSKVAFNYLLAHTSSTVTVEDIEQVVSHRLMYAFNNLIINDEITIEEGVLYELVRGPNNSIASYVVAGILALFDLNPKGLGTKVICLQLSELLRTACPRKIVNWNGTDIKTFELLSKSVLGKTEFGEITYTFKTSSGDLIFSGEDSKTGLVNIIDSTYERLLAYQRLSADQDLNYYPLLFPAENYVEIQLVEENPNKWVVLNNQVALSGFISAKSKIMENLKENNQYCTPAEINFHKMNALESC